MMADAWEECANEVQVEYACGPGNTGPPATELLAGLRSGEGGPNFAPNYGWHRIWRISRNKEIIWDRHARVWRPPTASRLGPQPRAPQAQSGRLAGHGAGSGSTLDSKALSGAWPVAPGLPSLPAALLARVVLCCDFATLVRLAAALPAVARLGGANGFGATSSGSVSSKSMPPIGGSSCSASKMDLSASRKSMNSIGVDKLDCTVPSPGSLSDLERSRNRSPLPSAVPAPPPVMNGSSSLGGHGSRGGSRTPSRLTIGGAAGFPNINLSAWRSGSQSLADKPVVLKDNPAFGEARLPVGHTDMACHHAEGHHPTHIDTVGLKNSRFDDLSRYMPKHNDSRQPQSATLPVLDLGAHGGRAQEWVREATGEVDRLEAPHLPDDIRALGASGMEHTFVPLPTDFGEEELQAVAVSDSPQNSVRPDDHIATLGDNGATTADVLISHFADLRADHGMAGGTISGVAEPTDMANPGGYAAGVMQDDFLTPLQAAADAAHPPTARQQPASPVPPMAVVHPAPGSVYNQRASLQSTASTTATEVYPVSSPVMEPQVKVPRPPKPVVQPAAGTMCHLRASLPAAAQPAVVAHAMPPAPNPHAQPVAGSVYNQRASLPARPPTGMVAPDVGGSMLMAQQVVVSPPPNPVAPPLCNQRASIPASHSYAMPQPRMPSRPPSPPAEPVKAALYGQRASPHANTQQLPHPSPPQAVRMNVPGSPVAQRVSFPRASPRVEDMVCAASVMAAVTQSQLQQQQQATVQCQVGPAPEDPDLRAGWMAVAASALASSAQHAVQNATLQPAGSPVTANRDPHNWMANGPPKPAARFLENPTAAAERQRDSVRGRPGGCPAMSPGPVRAQSYPEVVRPHASPIPQERANPKRQASASPEGRPVMYPQVPAPPRVEASPPARARGSYGTAGAPPQVAASPPSGARGSFGTVPGSFGNRPVPPRVEASPPPCARFNCGNVAAPPRVEASPPPYTRASVGNVPAPPRVELTPPPYARASYGPVPAPPQVVASPPACARGSCGSMPMPPRIDASPPPCARGSYGSMPLLSPPHCARGTLGAVPNSFANLPQAPRINASPPPYARGSLGTGIAAPPSVVASPPACQRSSLPAQHPAYAWAQHASIPPRAQSPGPVPAAGPQQFGTAWHAAARPARSFSPPACSPVASPVTAPRGSLGGHASFVELMRPGGPSVAQACPAVLPFGAPTGSPPRAASPVPSQCPSPVDGCARRGPLQGIGTQPVSLASPATRGREEAQHSLHLLMRAVAPEESPTAQLAVPFMSSPMPQQMSAPTCSVPSRTPSRSLLRRSPEPIAARGGAAAATASHLPGHDLAGIFNAMSMSPPPRRRDGAEQPQPQQPALFLAPSLTSRPASPSPADRIQGAPQQPQQQTTLLGVFWAGAQHPQVAAATSMAPPDASHVVGQHPHGPPAQTAPCGEDAAAKDSILTGFPATPLAVVRQCDP